MVAFPSDEWIKTFGEELNASAAYAAVAEKWEGDFYYIVTPEGPLKEKVVMYIDLWHGKCRDAYVVENVNEHKAPAFRLSAPLSIWRAMHERKLEFTKAALTRKVKVRGNMMKLMMNAKISNVMTDILLNVPTEFPERY